jgi:drug/metabolite transporter (DMT)-like permease
MDIFFALVSALLTAVYFVYLSKTMKARSGLSSTLTLAVSHLSAAILLLPLWALSSSALSSIVSPPLFLVAAAGGLLFISRELYFYAYARTDVANITIFSALTPVYALLTGYLWLHEVPSYPHLAGLLLICISIYAYFLEPVPSMSLAKAVVQPFRHIATSRPIFCAFLSTLPTAFAATFQKDALSHFDPVTFSFVLLSIIGSAALLLSCAMFKASDIKRQLTLLPVRFYIISALLLAGMHVAFCVVMNHYQTAVSLVLQRSSLVFQIILAYIYLHERQRISKRLTVAFCIMAGFMLIILT